MLAAHPSICSMPETQFFSVLVGGLKTRMQLQRYDEGGHIGKLLKAFRLRLGVAYPRNIKAMQRLSEFNDLLGMDEMKVPGKWNCLFLKDCAREFEDFMDAYAEKSGKEIWVEKSPNHLYYIEEIERYICDAKFVHIVRRGEDVVASIFDAAQKGSKGNDFSCSISENVDRWNSGIRVTSKYAGEHNHFVVRYEDLVSDPRVELEKLCDFLGVKNTEGMLDDRLAAASSLIRSSESWKQGAVEEIESNRPSKFTRVFTDEQQKYICENLEVRELP